MARKSIGSRREERAKSKEKNSDPHWMEKAFGKNPGALHRATGTPEGKKIPASKAEVHKGDSTKVKREKNLAEIGKKYGGR